MKIAYVLRSLEDSGVTVYCLRLADGMRRRGHDVFFVSDDGVYADQVRRMEFRHYPLPLCRNPLTSYLAARRLADVVAGERPDILHGNWRRAQLACHLAEKKLGIPFVTTLHLVGVPDSWLYRRLSFWGHRVIAPCSEAATYLREAFGVPADRIRLIHHGVDPADWPQKTDRSRRAARQELGLPDDAPVAVCVGRLERIKDHATMLRGLAEAARRRPELRLLLVGRGAEDKSLERLAAELGIGRQVRFLGFTDPHPPLAASDLFLLTSLRESFGFAPVEAMLSGLAVVRTASQGAADQIRPGQTGQIIPLGDARAVARVLESLATEGDLWRQRGQAAAEDARRRFTLAGMAERVEKVYREVLMESRETAGRQ